jgi:HEAT repeat protein
MVATLWSLALLPTSRGQAPDADEAVIDRLIDVLKDEASSKDQRANACLALGKRGAKAKRAVPEMVSFLEAVLKDDRFSKGGVAAERVAKVAEGLGNIGTEAKEAVLVLNKVIVEGVTGVTPKGRGAEGAATEALGKIGSKDAFAALAKASTNERNIDVRKAAVKGLGHMARNLDSDLRVKALAQLQVIAETDLSQEVQQLASEAIKVFEGKNDKLKETLPPKR